MALMKGASFPFCAPGLTGFDSQDQILSPGKEAVVVWGGNESKR